MKSAFAFALAAILSTVHAAQIHPVLNSNKCLELRGGVITNGQPVQIFDCNGSPAQNWTFVRGAVTAVQLTNTAFCLDSGSTPGNGVLMKLWQCFANLPAQEWVFTADNRIAQTSGQCLDLPNGNTTNTNQIQTWLCTDNDVNQIWTS